MAVSRIDEAGLNVTQYGNRNVIINGDMRIAQRGVSFTVTNEYGLDRWFCRENTDGALTFSQDSNVYPDGFSKSLKVNVDTADTSIGSSQFAYVAQRIEGYNIQPFAFGSSAAKKITLSFYVRCSVTGKFGGAIVNGDNNNRSHAFTYDVNTANTWERKTITFDGDTTGTWNIDNSQEMAVLWSLGGGSGVKKAEGSWDATAGVQSATEATTELIENASATWFMTGVQLEVGDTATEFEHRNFGYELELCQRYFEKSHDMGSPADDSSTAGFEGVFAPYTSSNGYSNVFMFCTRKRTDPTMSFYRASNTGSTDGRWAYYNGQWNDATTTTNASLKENGFSVSMQSSSAYTARDAILFSGHWAADSEL